jgi:glutamate 5-kinase
MGKRPVIVSSGAAAAGMMAFGIKERPNDLSELQACCAVGQTRLMHFYETLFRQYGLNVAQLLLTNEDFSTPNRILNVNNTFENLLQHDDVIPIVNENDSVATEELKFGDNDSLSASLSILINASLLVILTEVDGLMDSDGNVIADISDIDGVTQHVRSETGAYSVGGMSTKLEALAMASRSGIPGLIANGRKFEQLPELINGEGLCSRITI